MSEVTIEIKDKNYVAEWSRTGKSFFRNADAQKVASEIEGIGESVTRREIVDYAAEHPESELHKCMEWDDKKAADHYRIQQAGAIITSLHITVIREDKDPEPTEIRYFSMPKLRGGGYSKTEVIVQDIDQRELLIRKSKYQFEVFRRKYETLSEWETVFEAYDNAFA